MEGPYENISVINSIPCRPLPPQKAPQGSKMGLYGALLFLGLVCVSLLAGVIILGIFYGNSERDDQLPTETTLTCPSGWNMSQSRCYFLSSITGPWETGKQDCTNKEAHLMTINSTAEQVYISSFKDDIWIGLNDLEEETTWKWFDGSLLILSYWEVRQPDSQGEEDCVRVSYNGRWHDDSCSKLFHWMCERRPLSYVN